MQEILIINESDSDNLGNLVINKTASKIFKAEVLMLKHKKLLLTNG
ncbi:hypothetical protein BDD30_3959 [Photorhabdus asymbiotica]|uniref:Uncharacterized protein n=1 Tax=Photorhabdus asymbiotica TaxID=291112 RepID=A0ABX9SI69_9GAMM|nr:hypothetical protein BDD30_3959 [Photorhabdus asymbiotica]